MKIHALFTLETQLSFCWSGSQKGGGQNACITTDHGTEESTLGTYPGLGYKKALAIPGPKSKKTLSPPAERECEYPHP